jgi:hypothetical protein
VRVNFQYAVDVLCGSLNRACDVKKLFQYIGMKNTQSPIRIEFVFANESYYDPEFNRTFYPSQAKLFACDQPVLLPHVSREKCTCMDCNAMCPKINRTKTHHVLSPNSTWTEKVISTVNKLHLPTKAAIILYVIFVVLFAVVNAALSICNANTEKRQRQEQRLAQSTSNYHRPD